MNSRAFLAFFPSPSNVNILHNFTRPSSIGYIQKCFVHHHKEFEENMDLYLGIRRSNKHRANRNTHVNEKKFSRLRGQKTVIIELDDDVELRQMKKMTPDQFRIAMLRKGRNPYKEIGPREWQEHQITFQSMYSVLDPYMPPEKSQELIDLPAESEPMSWKKRGKDLLISKKDWAMHKWHNRSNGLQRIKKKDGFKSFNIKEFPTKAEEIYIDAQKALMNRDEEQMQRLITEHGFAKFWPEVQKGSLSWDLLRFIEPSKVVSIRCIDNPPKSGNDIAQIIVRMHSLQKLALYDKFGRLLLGSETEPAEYLEYVLFENHVASQDGVWRLHDKIYPNWLKPKKPINRQSLVAKEAEDPSKKKPTRSYAFTVGMQKRIDKAEKEHREKEKEKSEK